MDDDEAKPSPGPSEPLEAPWAYRGKDLSRVLALSDGIFAFAMTLLVLGLALPAYASGTGVDHYLWTAHFLYALYGYIVTFFVIGLWWQAHHLVFSYIKSFNRRLFQINIVFLVLIAILPFATGVLAASDSARVGVIFFAALQVVTGLTLLGLWLYASGSSGLVPAHLPKEWNRAMRAQMITAPAVFALSIPVAFVNTVLAEYVWLLTFVVIAIRSRQRAALQSGPTSVVPPSSTPHDPPLASTRTKADE